MDINIQERRKYFRVSVDIPVRYRILNQNDKKPLAEWLQGTAENIAPGGIRLRAFCEEKEIEILTNEYILLALEFQLPASKEKLTIEANIAYLKTGNYSNNKKLVNIGLAFMSLSEEYKEIISSFIRSQIANT